MADQTFNLIHTLDPTRDSYGFALRPQHAQRYREYANIYKEEEEERSDKWKDFLQQLSRYSRSCFSEREHEEELQAEVTEQEVEINLARLGEGEDTSNRNPSTDGLSESDPEKEVHLSKETKARKVQLQTSAQIRSSLDAIENIMSSRVKKRKNMKDEPITLGENHLQSIEKTGSLKTSEDLEENAGFHDVLDENVSIPIAEDSEDNGTSKNSNTTGAEGNLGNSVSHRAHVPKEEFFVGDGVSYNVDGAEPEKHGSLDTYEAEKDINDGFNSSVNDVGVKKIVDEGIDPSSWKEELECLVRGGIPKDLRGEVWQAFVGVKTRQVERYYHDLVSQEKNTGESKDGDNLSGAAKKWKRQIEKDIPRTFPGHPALDENGRNSLRRLLFAYARHNPSVGYCQAMNFFAGLLLLLMPEENAFWTLVGILDDYFDGYYTEEMIESQVDQLVFEELMRERFPKLVNHLDYLGVQVAWISGPWFLSIFVNTLPWESVLRVWDVLLYDGNRVMLFRTALALMELYGPALVTTKDAGDATTLLQSLAGSTFDSSQLVLTACMGYLAVTEVRLQKLREKHRPAVLAVVEERSKNGRIWKDSKGLATKLYSFKHDPGSLIEEKKTTGGEKLAKGDKSHLEPPSTNVNDLLDHLAVDPEVDSLPDLQEQVVWLKVELCRLLEEKRSAILRAEELETALMEMVKQDNRRQLSARVEQLEQEVARLNQALSDKKEQEAAMLKVLMRIEQEQKVTEDARLCAEQDAAAQKYAVYVLQEKYEKAMASLAEMEKRVVMAESMLEATLQYQSGQVKAHSSPRAARNQGSTQENTRKAGLLPFGLGWRDRNKAKPTNTEESGESKQTNEQPDLSIERKKSSDQEQ